jgi:hypothetical protein
MLDSIFELSARMQKRVSKMISVCVIVIENDKKRSKAKSALLAFQVAA